MNMITTYNPHFPSHPYPGFPLEKLPAKHQRKFLKAVVLSSMHKLLCELLQNQLHLPASIEECYQMDSKIIQFVLQSIVETSEYTLEGIAYYTRIPFDVIYEAACGINNHVSITPWARIVDLYLQVKPDIAQMLVEKILEIKEKNRAVISMLLNEP